MSGLTNTDGSHERDTPESIWADKFFQYFIGGATKLGVQGFDVGKGCYEINHEQERVVIKFVVKK